MSLPRPLAYTFAALLLLTLYAPALNGAPIWDDNAFIFWRFGLNEKPDHMVYWRFHIWPLFDSLTALLYQWWGSKPLPWHLLNLTLHGINCAWCAHLVARWRPSWRWPLMLALIAHPMNVMAVAWIIQLKTVLTGTFILAAIHLALAWWGNGSRRHYAGALACYFLALATKSSALPFAFLPWLLLPWVAPRRRLMLATVPFILLSLGSAWRIQRNQTVQARTAVTEDRLARLADEVQIPPATVTTPVAPEPATAVVVPNPAPVSASHPEAPPADVAAPLDPPATVAETPAPIPSTAPLPSRRKLILHNLGEYWSLPFTLDGTPSRGPHLGGWSASAVLGWLAASLLLAWLAIRREDRPRARALYGLLIAQAALVVPFLGFVTAPYMLYTAVSEQHLYLTLPFAFASVGILYPMLAAKFKRPSAVHAPAVFTGWMVLVLGWQTLNYTPAYVSEEAFFSHVLAVRPHDVYGRLGLVAHYQQEGRNREAAHVLRDSMKAAERNPRMKLEPYWPTLEAAYLRWGLE